MPKRILATDQDQTPEADILGRDWHGDFQIVCTAYGSDPVKFQIRVEKEWIDVNFNKTDIELTKKGAVLDVTLAYDVDYRVVTANPGAEVFISRIDPHR